MPFGPRSLLFEHRNGLRSAIIIRPDVIWSPHTIGRWVVKRNGCECELFHSSSQRAAVFRGIEGTRHFLRVCSFEPCDLAWELDYSAPGVWWILEREPQMNGDER